MPSSTKHRRNRIKKATQSRKSRNHTTNKIRIPLQSKLHYFGHRAGSKSSSSSSRENESNSTQTESSSSRSSSKNDSTDKAFFKKVTLKFLNMLNTVILFHWKTKSYSVHKATEKLYGELNENIDKFVEIMLGKTGDRVNLMDTKQLPLDDFNTVAQFKSQIMKYKSFLVDLEEEPFMRKMANTDLFNIRDEILGNLNQFLYLLTFES